MVQLTVTSCRRNGSLYGELQWCGLHAQISKSGMSPAPVLTLATKQNAGTPAGNQISVATDAHVDVNVTVETDGSVTVTFSVRNGSLYG
jgi:hypothetical protein